MALWIGAGKSIVECSAVEQPTVRDYRVDSLNIANVEKRVGIKEYEVRDVALHDTPGSIGFARLRPPEPPSQTQRLRRCASWTVSGLYVARRYSNSPSILSTL